ncbi:MAG: hypothetical protein JO141_31710 [Bradyrhizobium sp.]|nr:hypothetical protein [Bradyrhizobium sp.]
MARVDAAVHDHAAVLFDAAAAIVVIDLIRITLIGIGFVVVPTRHVARACDEEVPAEAVMKTADEMRPTMECGNAAHRCSMEWRAAAAVAYSETAAVKTAAAAEAAMAAPPLLTKT